MEHVIVQSSLAEPMGRGVLAEKLKAVESILEEQAVQFLHAYVSGDGLYMIFHFAAPNVDAVRQVIQHADIPCDSIWVAWLISAPED